MKEHITTCTIQLEMSGADFNPESMTRLLERFFGIIALKINLSNSDQIGHIKGFCTGRENDYLKVSFVSGNRNIDVAGSWAHESDTAQLTVNIIALGFVRHDPTEIVLEAARKMKHLCVIAIKPQMDRVFKNR